MTRAHRLLLAVAETDGSCDKAELRGRPVWVCRCIHCRARIVVPLDLREPASATLEHIVPRTHGGSDALDNLALACARCNHAKGRRLDVRALDDPKLQEVIARLQERRRATMRTKPSG
jgi:5-methylcytosine-specific restriction endonuclease McrA